MIDSAPTEPAPRSRFSRIGRAMTWPARALARAWDSLGPVSQRCGAFLAAAWRAPENPIPRILFNARSFSLGALLSAGLLVGYAIWDCIYIVDVGQEGVHLRLGKFSHITQPGLNFQAPFGIDEVIMVNTEFVIQDEFGYRSKIEAEEVQLSSEEPEPAPDQGDQEVLELREQHAATVNEAATAAALQGHPSFIAEESEMLTGNLNILDVSWAFQYEVIDSYKFMFRSSGVHKTVRDVSAAAMSKAIGNHLDIDALTTKRAVVSEEARAYAQDILDDLDIGIRVKQVIIQDVSPPVVAQTAYHEVNSASQFVENLINKAEREYHSFVQRAYGEADELIANAEAYRHVMINRANGEASRLSAVLTEYKKAPQVTRERIFIETMQDLFTKVPFTVVDEEVKGLMPFFPGGGTAPNRAPQAGGSPGAIHSEAVDEVIRISGSASAPHSHLEAAPVVPPAAPTTAPAAAQTVDLAAAPSAVGAPVHTPAPAGHAPEPGQVAASSWWPWRNWR